MGGSGYFFVCFLMCLFLLFSLKERLVCGGAEDEVVFSGWFFLGFGVVVSGFSWLIVLFVMFVIKWMSFQVVAVGC